MRALFAEGVQWWNDVTGMRSAAAMQVVSAAPANARFVAMFARNRGPRAERGGPDATGLLEELRAFCTERIAAFAAAGIARDRLVLDPGMGLFLGRGSAPSLLVLSRLAELQREYGPLLVSMSRKSFLGVVAGTGKEQRAATTLAAELWAARAGVAWIRTHDVQALRAAWAVERAIADAP
jgi:dihydropteroate synthase type 2